MRQRSLCQSIPLNRYRCAYGLPIRAGSVKFLPTGRPTCSATSSANGRATRNAWRAPCTCCNVRRSECNIRCDAHATVEASSIRAWISRSGSVQKSQQRPSDHAARDATATVSAPQEDHVWVQNDDRLAVEVPILQPVRQRVPAASPGADVGQSRRRCGPVPAQMWAYRRSFAAPLVRARACSSVAAVIPDRCDARAWRHAPERAGGEADGRFVGGYESVGSPASSVSLYGLYL